MVSKNVRKNDNFLKATYSWNRPKNIPVSVIIKCHLRLEKLNLRDATLKMQLMVWKSLMIKPLLRRLIKLWSRSSLTYISLGST